MNDKKVVLITGGAMGQGRGHAYKYAENNFDVDKLDYIVRDTQMSGISNVSVDVERLLG